MNIDAQVTYLDIQRMSSEDGPGLRTTLFFKGCPLSCKWCHNPESISPKPFVQWMQSRCMGCGSCIKVCPTGAISGENGISVDRKICAVCLRCCDACPTGAIECKGRTGTVGELARTLVRDRAYFGSDGGVTLSGGEPLLQESAIDLLAALKQEKVAVAVDTCGLVPKKQLRAALELCDIVLFDLKIADTRTHREFTGADNAKILENFSDVSEWAKSGGRLWVRTPIIPGATDSADNITAIGEIIKERGGAERWELLAFNNLCRDKYTRLGIEWIYSNTPLIRKKHLDMLLSTAKKTGACRDIRAGGATEKE